MSVQRRKSFAVTIFQEKEEKEEDNFKPPALIQFQVANDKLYQTYGNDTLRYGFMLKLWIRLISSPW